MWTGFGKWHILRSITEIIIGLAGPDTEKARGAVFIVLSSN